MNSVERFFRHYVLSTIGILILFVCVNLALLAAFFAFTYASGAAEGTFPTEEFSTHITENRNGLETDAEAIDMLRNAGAWAMILNDSGTVIWEENLPDKLPRKYTVTDVALFSRWYLEDYPIRIWKRAEGLLVIGFQPGSVLQLYMSFKLNYFWFLLVGTVGIVIVNLLLMMFLFLRNTNRLEKAIGPILNGIRALSSGKSFHLEEKGELAEINTGLNHASDYLAKKDNTRAEWIRGISHDIRTPLSMILGYSSEIEDNPDLPAEVRRQAEIIRKQSEKLRTLVADLNLTTKLEYSMQPFRMKPLDPLELIRQVISEFLNNGLSEKYELELSGTDTDAETFLYGDSFLLNRMLHNLIQNSITHNPDGCQISVSVRMNDGICSFCIIDTGRGIKESYLALLNNNTSIPSSQTETVEAEHGLGLKIVRQIVKVHHGEIQFSNITPHGLKIDIHLPDKFKG